MNKFIRYVTLSNSSKIRCMAKGAKTFTTVGSHFVRPHENVSSCNLLINEDVQSMDRKEWLFYCVECKQSFFSCNVFTLIGYSFFGKIRRYFFTSTISFRSKCVFSFLDMLQYIRTTFMLIENCDLKMEHSTFPSC
jgi:hypothetical protein